MTIIFFYEHWNFNVAIENAKKKTKKRANNFFFSDNLICLSNGKFPLLLREYS